MLCVLLNAGPPILGIELSRFKAAPLRRAVSGNAPTTTANSARATQEHGWKGAPASLQQTGRGMEEHAAVLRGCVSEGPGSPICEASTADEKGWRGEGGREREGKREMGRNKKNRQAARR